MATDKVAVEPSVSTLSVPVTTDLSELGRALNAAIPKVLWTIDKPDQICAPSQKVKVLFAKITTPTVRCRITGRVTRGPIALSGSGRDIRVLMPLHATVTAKDIGGIIKQETAQADARVRAIVKLDLAPNWAPRGTISLAYDWTDAPHVDILGQRVEFASKADAKLKGVIADLERTLPRELAKLHVRDRVDQAWRAAFTSLELNKSDPPVWMRITPQQLAYGGYRIEGRRVTLSLGMRALTETFVGPHPADPPAKPLPSMTRLDRSAGEILFAIPVIADYRQLEPVLNKALAKRSQRPFDLPAIGPVMATFEHVTVYGTTGGKIAVGLTFRARREDKEAARGTIWMVARPMNAPNSRRVTFAELEVAGVTDSTGTNLLLRLANTPGLSDTIAEALTQNFSNDYDKLLVKIDKAIAEKRQGNLLIQAKISEVRTGRILATGEGVYLPVAGRGTASIAFRN